MGYRTSLSKRHIGYDYPIMGNTGNGFIDILGTGAYAVRLMYVATSGTGASPSSLMER